MRVAVERRLAACGQTWPIRSCYRWKGNVVNDEEHVLLLKSVDVHFGAACDVIRSLHSYDLPSIVMIRWQATAPVTSSGCWRRRMPRSGADARTTDRMSPDSRRPGAGDRISCADEAPKWREEAGKSE